MKQYKWCAIDAEGDVGDKGLLGVAFYDSEGGMYLTNHKEIAALIHTFAFTGHTFVAHNAEYDLGVIFWQLDIPMKAVYFNGRFNRGEWRHTPKKPMCQLWDSLALSGGLPLAKLGQSIGLPKYETPQQLLGIDPNRYNWICELHNKGECESCYAIRDAEIVYKYMESLTDTLSGWGIEPKRRLSGIASHVWRVLDRPQNIAIESAKHREFARQAYHGGRTETFKLGTMQPCFTADVTSMYPSVMATTAFPNPHALVDIKSPYYDTELIEYEGVIDAMVTVPSMYLPPLPYRYNGKLHYPVGRFRGIWTTRELRYARMLGVTIDKVYRLLVGQTNLFPFSDFIAVLWSLRESYIKDHDPRALTAKLIMNNLYGYLGMKESTERRDIAPAQRGVLIRNQPKTSWFTQDGELYLTYERIQPSRNVWTNVMWAAQITAAARVVLHQAMLQQGNSLIYCDTDSIFSLSPIVGLGEGLGGLRSDGDYQSCTIAAPKLYALQDFGGDWTAKAKGVSRSVAMHYLREGNATFKQPIRPSSQGRRGIKAGTWITVTKEQQYAPARRHPLDPQALLSGVNWSDTSPTVVLPE